MATVTLFVYGTLQRGQANNYLLADQAFVRRTRTLPRYRLYDAGSYPCLVEDRANGRAIDGELWQIEDRLLGALDTLEEAPLLFERVSIDVEGAPGFVTGYLYRGEVEQLADAGYAWPARVVRQKT